MKNSPVGEQKMHDELLVTIKINKLLDSRLPTETAVSDEQVKKFTEENKTLLALPEAIHARHILVAVKPDDDEAAKAAKRQKAEDLRKRLLEGADFATLAKENSDDISSAKRGGDLGMFRRGQMVKPFNDAAFSQDVNAIGPVVSTTFGYHIIQVLQHNEGGEPPRDKIVQLMQYRTRQQAVSAYIEELKSKAKIKDFRATR